MEYCLGFAFSPDQRYVLMIRKEHPSWQKGKLNGIGGKVETNETPVQAMVREFREEVGITTVESQWDERLTLSGAGGGDVEAWWKCTVFRMTFPEDTDIFAAKQVTDEVPVCVFLEGENHNLPDLRMMDNLRWIVPLLLDTQAKAHAYYGTDETGGY